MPDAGGEFFQWFYFSVRGAAGKDCVLRIENAGGVTYPDGWRDYRAVASEDGETWPRVATEYDGKVLTIRHRPVGDEVRFAYFAPYPMERHAELIERMATSSFVTARRLGQTLEGAPLDLLEIGGARARTCWIIGRQHPGETMAEWWMEGFLERLLDPADPLARALLEKARFFVVPNMNPDGSRRGHLRTNAAGINLNRAWAAPSMEESPEVFLVSAEMARTGVDFCLDVHGDEALALTTSSPGPRESRPTPTRWRRSSRIFRRHSWRRTRISRPSTAIRRRRPARPISASAPTSWRRPTAASP